MLIHRVKENETIRNIAEQYEISEDRIKENNQILTEPLAVGRELLILKPTRTYKAKLGDTPSTIAARFGVKTHSFTSNNPSLSKEGLKAGHEYAVKYPTPPYGAGAANGYYFAGAKLGDLKRVMPYLTYLTLGAYKLLDGNPVRIFDTANPLRLANNHGKVTLMRVYDGSDGTFYKDKKKRSALAEELVSLASSGGYRGITLACNKPAINFKDEFCEFLIELRKNMIGCDLILFVECDVTTPPEIAELSDGSVFMYAKHGSENPPSFKDGEQTALTAFADKTESSKALVFLNSDAEKDGEYIPIARALEFTASCGIIEHDEITLLNTFSYAGKRIVYESLENIKAKLDLIAELGFMGIAFNISCVLTEELMLTSSLFSPVHYQIPYSLPI